ncbi:MAG: response regulator [Verrucomicrobia bacterium]|nr:response regulator [Verrucomicrobiota bacterium]MDE3099337.1 response regulator [Verrucomicrobiota bacterium]
MGRLFKAFSQGDHASQGDSHRFGGLGLGLVIAGRLVELHNGRISAHSEGPGRGATFTIELPLIAEPINGEPSPAHAAAHAAGSHSANGDMNILLVEDHEPTRIALAQLLERRQYKVTAAGSIAEARALASAQTFQLLISDIGLPDGSGYELMAELQLVLQNSLRPNPYAQSARHPAGADDRAQRRFRFPETFHWPYVFMHSAPPS